MSWSRADLCPEEDRAHTSRTPATDMAALTCSVITQMRHLCLQFQHNISVSPRDNQTDSPSDDLQTHQQPHRCDLDHL
jgi:hypothetical protein